MPSLLSSCWKISVGVMVSDLWTNRRVCGLKHGNGPSERAARKITHAGDSGEETEHLRTRGCSKAPPRSLLIHGAEGPRINSRRR